MEKGGLGAPGPLPLVFSRWWHVSMAPFSFSFASTSFAAGAAARASAEQTHFHQGGRAVRRGLGKSSSPKPSPSPTDALKRLMYDAAAGTYWQDTRPNHREESSEPSAASHVTSATPPSSDVAMRPLLETRALSSEPFKVFIPGAYCFPAACVRSISRMMIASTKCDAGGG